MQSAYSFNRWEEGNILSTPHLQVVQYSRPPLTTHDWPQAVEDSCFSQLSHLLNAIYGKNFAHMLTETHYYYFRISVIH